MKILILMPIDERCVFASMGLYKRFNPELQKSTLNLVGFADYLYQTKKCRWEHAAATALSKDVPVEDYDIVIGNTEKCKEFDLIFNLYDGENDVPYKDYVIEKVEQLLDRKFELHTAEESKFCLRNFDAAADLLNSLYTKGKLKEEKLQEIEKEYEQRMMLSTAGFVPDGGGES